MIIFIVKYINKDTGYRSEAYSDADRAAARRAELQAQTCDDGDPLWEWVAVEAVEMDQPQEV